MSNIYGYIRVSSKDQNEDRQLIALNEVGVERKNVYLDKKSGKEFDRPQYKMTVLAYPSSISEPEGFHNEYDGTYNSFKVRVTLGGEVYVDIGASSYRVTVNDNNIPTKIHDYYGMTLR